MQDRPPRMAPSKPWPQSRRARLTDALKDAARAHSTATVLLHAAVAEQVGLSPTDSKTLHLLARFGPLTAGELVDRTGLASASVTALIDRLEARGFVRRVRDDADRRRVIVELAPQAAQKMARLFAGLRESVDELWAPYTIKE